MSQRILWVDALRGIAIVLMIIFHFCYDLRYFMYVDWQIPNGPNWWPFRYLILTLFIFTVGLSLTLAHNPKFKRINFIRRLSQLLVASIAITIMSLFLFPNAWIYFGILHFISAASIIGIVLVGKPVIALIVGAGILVLYWLGIASNEWPFNLLSGVLPTHTEDYVPIFPWLGVMFAGIAFGGLVMPRLKYKTKNKKLRNEKILDIPKNKLTYALAFMGKHGLIIYLLHQPLFFAGFYMIEYVKN